MGNETNWHDNADTQGFEDFCTGEKYACQHGTLNPAWGEAFQAHVERVGWPFFKVAVLIPDSAGQILCIKEHAGWKQTKAPWNIPAGQIRLGETMQQAAVRLAREKGGADVVLDRGCHIGYRNENAKPYLLVAFIAKLISYDGQFTPGRADASTWKTLDEIEQMLDQGMMRNSDLIRGVLTGYQLGGFPPECIVDYTPRQR